jgi:pyruvate/2-oxoglutarate/acetoin dehydrogenase E1 component
MGTVAETIRSITRKHLTENNGLLFGQCLSAVGWVGGTVPSDIPDNKGIEELPTSDVSNGGIVVGAALAGRRPIYISRYQGFMWYNAASLVNYAAKSKEMCGVPCPVFIRAIGMEGGIGPVAGGMHHSMVARMPGIKVVAPMTSQEYTAAWYDFMHNNDPVYCSEHRLSYGLENELQDYISPVDTNVSILAIGAGRINAWKAIEALEEDGIYVNLLNIVHLSPFILSLNQMYTLAKPHKLLIVDSDYTRCGITEHIAYTMSKPVWRHQCTTLGLEDRTAGFSPATDNKTPSVEKIIQTVKELI